MSGTVTYTYALGAAHDNQLPATSFEDEDGVPCSHDAAVDDQGSALPAGYPKYTSGGLPCDGTVYVGDADDVCYATVTYTVGGTGQYDGAVTQKIMNVPYLDATRLPLYMAYFVNDQVTQMTGTPPDSLAAA